MDTTQQRHTPSSIAEQELFFPSPKPSSQQAQGQHEYDQQTHSSNRWYDALNNESPTVPSGSGVPAVNIIPATPTTYRSNSVRSQWSYKDPNRTKHAADAVPEEEEDEEDNIYDPPSKPRVDIYDPPADHGNNTADDIYDPPSKRSPSPPSPVESRVTVDEMASSSQQPQHQPAQDNYYVSPMSEPAVLHHDTGYSQPPNGHPTAEDKGKAPEPVVHHNDTGYTYSVPDGHRIPDDKGKSPEPPASVPVPEDRPPLPGPRPSHEPEVADYYAQAHASDPSIQEQEDRDYAMALALQEEEEGNHNRPDLPQRPSQGSSGWGSSGPLPPQQPSHPMSPEDEDRALAMRLQHEEEHGGPAPPLPARPHPDAVAAMLKQQQEPAPFTRTPSTEGFIAPPRRQGSDFGADDPNNPVHYSRDPHKLIAYLVPFPKPWMGARGPAPPDKGGMPTRFLVYTPPPPPLQAPPEGVKEGVTHKVQRKWQAEVRQAKQSDAKTTSWAGFKAKCTRGVDKAMQYTTTSNLDFLARVTPPPAPASSSSTSNLARKLSLKGKGRRNKSKDGKDGDVKGKDSVDVDEKAEESGKPADETTKAADEKAKEAGVYDKAREAGSEEKAREENPFEEKFSEEKARDEKSGGKFSEDIKEEDVQDDDPAHGSHETKKTVGVEEIVFVYPPSMNMTPEQMREEFVNTMLRTKSKAQRDAIIATGLLPVSLAIDLVMIAISGLFEVNAVWAYFTIKGTKTARSVTKRIASTSQDPETIDPEKSEKELEKENKLKITFKPAHRIDVLSSYLYAECHRVDSRLFPRYSHAPTEVECLEAIGWSPSRTGGQKNWEDEAWEVNDVKDDLKVVMHKGAKEWRKWCNRYEKDPEKSLKK
ncbi:hypothetical protein CGCS363_v011927 [Colletotrichum siamense]|uniref:uncharacterized protein n=1 Tax=Colletotrichum siamense TaxID=690259 RepID=UPI001872FEAF|nr:uncharacterized protein CGCS363_v011927 [Colletotrichum siamense]KAF5489555.1 hypothetical protein CGCS363_v011927 [Colletotrichum siamense]